MTVRLERVGAAAVLTVDRPERRNALDPESLRALATHAKALKREADVRGVVLTGSAEGGGFLSGGDLQALAGVKTARGAREMARAAHAAVDALRALGVPLVAAVGGDAYGGGCEFAAACDYRVVDEGASFTWVQTRFAVTTGWGGAANLLALVPRGTATGWLLTARPVSCDEARAAGFVDEVAPRGQAVSRAVAFVEAVAKQPKVAVRRMLVLLRESSALSPAMARRLELDHFGRSWATRDHHDAVQSFLTRAR